MWRKTILNKNFPCRLLILRRRIPKLVRVCSRNWHFAVMDGISLVDWLKDVQKRVNKKIGNVGGWTG